MAIKVIIMQIIKILYKIMKMTIISRIIFKKQKQQIILWKILVNNKTIKIFQE